MKKRIILLSIVTATILLSTSCKKECVCTRVAPGVEDLVTSMGETSAKDCEELNITEGDIVVTCVQ